LRHAGPASRRAWVRAAAAFVALAGPLDLLILRAAARRTAPHPELRRMGVKKKTAAPKGAAVK